MDQGGAGHGLGHRVTLYLFTGCRNAPYVGMLTIWLNDYPTFKWAVIGLMFLTVLVSRDPS